jgi:hypothetical protein
LARGDWQIAKTPKLVLRTTPTLGREYTSVGLQIRSESAGVSTCLTVNMRIQVDGSNLTDILDVIDFGGLFSGNTIGPPRSVAARLVTTF